MQESLEKEIVRVAKRILNKDTALYRSQVRAAARFRKRTAISPGEPVRRNRSVERLHNFFDAKYCIHKRKFIAKLIWSKLLSREYDPLPAVRAEIPKPNGKTRTIMIFSIVDTAVANIFARALFRKNKAQLSPFSYAYRKDRSIFDAIIHINSVIKRPRSFVVQLDFSSYFDNIRHDFLERMMSDSDEISISVMERFVLNRFLNHKFAMINEWRAGDYEPRTRGTPQGSSLSLFLANFAGHHLDKEMEIKNGNFARFADDIVVVCGSYKDAVSVQESISEFCHLSGVFMNFDKSDPISLLCEHEKLFGRDFFEDGSEGGDLPRIERFDYLGHQFSMSGISISESAKKRIKRRLAKIIYNHLLLYPKRGQFRASRVGPGFVDWDLVTCLNEIRGYIYGGLTELEIHSFLYNDEKLRKVRGLMAFYPLVSLSDAFVELDGWLINMVLRAYRERVRVISRLGISVVDGINRQTLLRGGWYNFPEISQETSVPSFVKGWRAARKYYKWYGLEEIEAPSYYDLLRYI